MSQNIKFKVKQFEWFEMQTKVRQIIQQVLGPLQKRILENSSTLNRVKFNQGEDQKKIQQITLMIQNDPKVFETGIFASVDKRFEQQQKKIQELSRQIDEENKYVDQKFKILDIRMQESSQVLQNVASLRQRVSKEIEIQNQNINTVRTNIEQMITDLNADIRVTRKIQQQNLENCEKADYKLNQSILKNIQDIKYMKETLDEHKQLHKQEAFKLQVHSQTLKNHTEEIEGLQESKVMTKKLTDYVKDLQNQLRMMEFKLEVVSPLITQAQISQCLYNVLPQKMKKRIAIHEYKKYSILNKQVLQKKYNEVGLKFKGLDLLQQMQKKNTKQIVQLKRKKLLTMGIDIDHLTYQQRQRYYNEIVLEENLDDDDEQVKVTAKVDEKQVLGIVNKHFSDFISHVKEKVAIQLEDSKKYIYGFEQEFKYEISGFDGKIKALKEQINVYMTENSLQSKSIAEEIKCIYDKFQENQNFHDKLDETQKTFYNFCSLVNHLQIQDEIDKQNISLMGVNENNSQDLGGLKNKNNSIIQLDKKCFSCCGFPASTLSAFKMACLAYNPSSITIQTKQYRREQLLGITTNLLQKIKKNFTVSNERVLNSNLSNIRVSINRNDVQLDRIDNIEELPQIKNDEQNDSKKHSSGAKFRKTKKFVGNSATKYYHQNVNNRSVSKQSTPLKDDILTSTMLFSELKKRNLTFLN